ncbi:hypothetical protein ACRE_089280 [Hapsidospora chrysogenum ATCC 11550]|uniref:Uncharacterized protein n=1 Tax=Hapsidospora chrysogenum (strain ATCC 11550 / CBS 779.69 / DSM 880 / IAM 14645 / JCM 23072 / IMI 49137) TaxID=857340 RepID=A0A086STH7_HAPC1|nr:hypothetical protein ACRE_089280 [Hapsidospora chrysogenum ATCC 11550]
MAENWDTVSSVTDDGFLTYRGDGSLPRQSRPPDAQRVRFDLGPSEPSDSKDAPTRGAHPWGGDEWRDFDDIYPEEGIGTDWSPHRRHDSQYRDYNSERRSFSRGPSPGLDSDCDPYDEDNHTYYRRKVVITDDEPSRSPSPSRHMPSRTSRYHAASAYGSAYGRRRLGALRERIAEKKNVIMDLDEYIRSMRDLLDAELDRKAQRKEELEEELGRQQRLNEGLRSLLLSCLEQLKEYHYKHDIREKRLAALEMDEMDHGDAALQDESIRTGDDVPDSRSIEDLPKGTTRKEHTTQRLRRIREERTALEEEAKEAPMREKALREKIDGLRDVLAEGTLKEAEYSAIVERQRWEQRQTEEGGRRGIKYSEDRLHEVGRELQSLMREELEVEQSLRRPWQSHQPYDTDGGYGDDTLHVTIGDSPPGTYVPPRQHRPPPHTPGGDDDTWTMLDEDVRYDDDTYPLTFDHVEKAGLSVSLPLNMAAGAAPPGIRDENSLFTLEALAWKLHRVALSDQQSETQLTVVHASEYSAGGTGFGKTTLICPAGPQKPDNESAVQMRWLYATPFRKHVRQPSLKFKTLEQLVLNCPFLTEALRTVAIEAIDKVREKFSGVSDCGPFLEPGSILRFLGRYNDRSSDDPDSDETEAVLFLSAPFLNLQPNATGEPSQDEYRPRTLLQFLYGYDIGGLRENGQVVQKLGAAKSKKDMLHVSQIWCFLIGSKILITVSDKSASEIQGKSIVTAALIERDYNYADFLRYAVSLVADQEADASDYELFDWKAQMLTPKRWIQILGSPDSQLDPISTKRLAKERVQFQEVAGSRESPWEKTAESITRTAMVKLLRLLSHLIVTPHLITSSLRPRTLLNTLAEERVQAHWC